MRSFVTGLVVAALLTVLPGAALGQPSSLAEKGQAAAAAMQAGRYDEAATIYRGMLEEMPGEPGLLMNLGMALAMGGHDAEAVGPLEEAVRRNPSLLPAQLFLGTSQLALGKPEAAIPPLQRVVEKKPNELEPRHMLASALSAAGRTRDAVAQLEAMTEIDPRSSQAWYALAQGYNAIAQEAMATFDADPAAEPWRRLLVADALAADGRLTDAFALYRELTAALPAMEGIHDSIAAIYEKTGHADWAAAERARGRVPAAACAERAALCAFRAGKLPEALAASFSGDEPEQRYWRVRAATELARRAFAKLDELPDSRERREARGALARAERRYTDAIAEYTAALEFAPGDPTLLEELGTSQYLAREYEKAIATLAPLVASQPDNAQLQVVYGDALLQLQRVKEAIPVLTRALTVDPRHETGRSALARAHMQAGDPAAAVPLLESLMPTDLDGSIHLQLARALSATGRRAEAAPLLEKARELQRKSQQAAAAARERAITPP